MDGKTIGLVVVVAMSFFFVGRSSSPTKTEVVYRTEFVATELKDTSKEEEKDVTKIVTVVERFDGTKITRTKLSKKNKTIDKTTEVLATSKQTTDEKITENKRRFILGPVMGLNVHNVLHDYSFGMHGYAQVAGPFGVGVSLLTNGQFQIYGGIEF